jgi:hypothetical protein
MKFWTKLVMPAWNWGCPRLMAYVFKQLASDLWIIPIAIPRLIGHSPGWHYSFLKRLWIRLHEKSLSYRARYDQNRRLLEELAALVSARQRREEEGLLK